MNRYLTRLVSFFYHIMMLVIIIALLFAGKIPYNEFHKRDFALPDLILLPIGVAVLFLIKVLAKRMSDSKKSHYVLFGLMFILPFVVSLGAAFMTGWDAGGVAVDAFTLVQGGSIDAYYYSMYPNNRLILLLITIIARAGVTVGLSGTAALYMLVVFIQCIVFLLTGLLVYDYLNMKAGAPAANIGSVLYIVFIGMSPWVYIAYTDAMGLIFPILILWLSERIPDKTWWMKALKWLLIVVVAVTGYNMKAPVFIMFIAVIISLILKALSDIKSGNFASDLILIILVMVLSIGLIKVSDRALDNAFEKIVGQERDAELAVSPFYYLMMGHNYDRDGTVNNDDMTLSMYISSYDERVSRNKAVLKDRVKEMWPDGLLQLYIRKLVLNYNDGSFGYGLGGEGFIEEELSGDSIFNIPIRYFYWPGRGGFMILLHTAQILWLGILFFGLMLKPGNRGDVSCCLSIMGITAFTLLFEAQARYLFVMAPIFVCVAAKAITAKTVFDK